MPIWPLPKDSVKSFESFSFSLRHQAPIPWRHRRKIAEAEPASATRYNHLVVAGLHFGRGHAPAFGGAASSIERAEAPIWRIGIR